MTDYLPPLKPIPPPLRMVDVCSGIETKESKELTAKWYADSAEIAAENEMRRRHNETIREQKEKENDKISLMLWFDEENGKAVRLWIGDQDGREVAGAELIDTTSDRITISFPVPR